MTAELDGQEIILPSLSSKLRELARERDREVLVDLGVPSSIADKELDRIAEGERRGYGPESTAAAPADKRNP